MSGRRLGPVFMFSKGWQRIGLMAGAYALAGAAALSFGSRSGDAEIRPGTEVLSMQEEGIRAITYRTGAMTFTARRSDDGPFAVLVGYSDSRARKQCQVSADLGGVLPGLAKITARRQLTPHQAQDEFPVEAGTLKLEDQVNEPVSLFSVRLKRDLSAVALLYADTAVEADLVPAAFARLEALCVEKGW